MAWTVKLKPLEILINEGEVSHSMYLVQEGRLLVTQKGLSDDIILGFIEEGELVGELSFLDQEPRSATVQAVKDCTLYQIPLKSIEELFQSQPKWFEVFIKTLVARLREA